MEKIILLCQVLSPFICQQAFIQQQHEHKADSSLSESPES